MCHAFICCSTLQCFAVCCSVLRTRANSGDNARIALDVSYIYKIMLQHVAVCCSMLQYVAVCYAPGPIFVMTPWAPLMWHTSIMLLCCSELRHVTVYCRMLHTHSNFVDKARTALWFVRHHSASMCATWLVHMWDMTHSYVRYDSFITYETSLVHTRDMNRSYVRHDSFICVT